MAQWLMALACKAWWAGFNSPVAMWSRMQSGSWHLAFRVRLLCKPISSFLLPSSFSLSLSENNKHFLKRSYKKELWILPPQRNDKCLRRQIYLTWFKYYIMNTCIKISRRTQKYYNFMYQLKLKLYIIYTFRKKRNQAFNFWGFGLPNPLQTIHYKQSIEVRVETRPHRFVAQVGLGLNK